MSKPKFKMKRGRDEQWYFRLVAPNGETVATSEGYMTKGGCENGIEAVRKAAAEAEVEEE